MWKRFQVVRAEDQFTDAVLVAADGAKIRVHRAVLAAASPFFATYFEAFAETHRDGEEEYPLGLQLTGKELAEVVGYAYGRPISLFNYRHLPRAVELGRYFELQGVLTDCQAMALANLDIDNAVELWLMAEAYDLQPLRVLAMTFVYERMQEVRKTPTFLSLELEHLTALARDDRMCAPEEDMLWAVLEWVRHDVDARSAHVDGLLRELKLPLVHPHVLARLSASATAPEWGTALDEAIDWQMSHHATREWVGWTDPREGSSVLAYVSVLEKNGARCLMAHSKYPSEMGFTTRNMGTFPADLDGYQLQELNNCVYVMGGSVVGRGPTDTVLVFDAWFRMWATSLPMIEARSGFASACHGGKIYVFGGLDGRGNKMDSCEVHDPVAHTWTTLPPMPYPAGDHCAVTVGDCIYVIGGDDELGDRCCVYSVGEGAWGECHGRLCVKGRNKPAAGAVGGAIYVVGGVPAAPAERYRPQEDSWEEMEESSTVNSSGGEPGCCVTGGYCLYFVTGSPQVSYLWNPNRAMPSGRWIPTQMGTWQRTVPGMVTVPMFGQ